MIPSGEPCLDLPRVFLPRLIQHVMRIGHVVGGHTVDRIHMLAQLASKFGGVGAAWQVETGNVVATNTTHDRNFAIRIAHRRFTPVLHDLEDEVLELAGKPHKERKHAQNGSTSTANLRIVIEH